MMAINADMNDPLINGEKTKEVTVGEIVLISKLDKPNTSPIPAPFSFPRVIAAMITGMCSVVARKGPIGMNPKKGTMTINSSIAIKSDMNARFFVFLFFIFPPLSLLEECDVLK